MTKTGEVIPFPAPLGKENQKDVQGKGTNFLPLLNGKALRRFWAKTVGRTDSARCWVWTGAQDRGYGRFSLGSHTVPAHRVSWVIANQREIPAGREVDHTCENRSCVNPDHLRLASHAENMAHVAGPLFESALLDRARAHRKGEPIDSLPIDSGVVFLAYTWRGANEMRGSVVARVEDGRKNSVELNTLRSLLVSSDEQTAFLALCEVVKRWSDFRQFAASEFGLWGGDPERAPRQPSLSALKGADGVSAMLSFWATGSEGTERRKWVRAYGARGWVIRAETIAELQESCGKGHVCLIERRDGTFFVSARDGEDPLRR